MAKTGIQSFAKDVLFGHNASEAIPVFPGSMHTLFLTVSGIEVCWMYYVSKISSWP